MIPFPENIKPEVFSVSLGDFTFTLYWYALAYIFGIMAGNIPFSNNNQAKQNIVNYSQAKQAIGIYITTYKDRMDISQILYNPQRPLVLTK